LVGGRKQVFASAREKPGEIERDQRSQSAISNVMETRREGGEAQRYFGSVSIKRRKYNERLGLTQVGLVTKVIKTHRIDQKITSLKIKM